MAMDRYLTFGPVFLIRKIGITDFLLQEVAWMEISYLVQVS